MTSEAAVLMRLFIKLLEDQQLKLHTQLHCRVSLWDAYFILKGSSYGSVGKHESTKLGLHNHGEQGEALSLSPSLHEAQSFCKLLNEHFNEVVFCSKISLRHLFMT